MSGQHWLIYALGGGMGHLTRALALSRAAASIVESPGARRITILTNSSYARLLPVDQELRPNCHLVALTPSDKPRDVLESLNHVIRCDPPDLMVVDTFPRGIGGELAEWLPSLKCVKVLVHRDLTPAYAERTEVRTMLRTFDHLLLPGESGPLGSLRPATSTAPWLIRDSNELLGPRESRRRLREPRLDRRIVVVVGCGRDSEAMEMRELAVAMDREFRDEISVRFASFHWHESSSSRGSQPLPTDHLHLNVWPLLSVLRGVSLLIGAGGYNTVQEARATGTPLIGDPRPRMYDRQEVRLRQAERVGSFQELRRRIQLLAATPVDVNSATPAPHYENGVHRAVEVLNGLVLQARSARRD